MTSRVLQCTTCTVIPSSLPTSPCPSRLAPPVSLGTGVLKGGPCAYLGGRQAESGLHAVSKGSARKEEADTKEKQQYETGTPDGAPASCSKLNVTPPFQNLFPLPSLTHHEGVKGPRRGIFN